MNENTQRPQTTVIRVRLPNPLYTQLRAAAASCYLSLSEIAERCLRAYRKRLEAGTAPDLELYRCDRCGSLTSTNLKATVDPDLVAGLSDSDLRAIINWRATEAAKARPYRLPPLQIDPVDAATPYEVVESEA
jgi:hypothetical protein